MVKGDTRSLDYSSRKDGIKASNFRLGGILVSRVGSLLTITCQNASRRLATLNGDRDHIF